MHRIACTGLGHPVSQCPVSKCAGVLGGVWIVVGQPQQAGCPRGAAVALVDFVRDPLTISMGDHVVAVRVPLRQLAQQVSVGARRPMMLPRSSVYSDSGSASNASADALITSRAKEGFRTPSLPSPSIRKKFQPALAMFCPAGEATTNRVRFHRRPLPACPSRSSRARSSRRRW